MLKAERDAKAIEGMATAVAILVTNDLENRSALPVIGIMNALDDWDDSFGPKFREAYQAKMIEFANRIGGAK